MEVKWYENQQIIYDMYGSIIDSRCAGSRGTFS